MRDLEIWGGVECSVNRVGDRWQDQMELSGHAHRIDDLDLIADLGIRTLRYPVLWERIAPQFPEARDWTWADKRLHKLRALAIKPIVGLMHHGSGPQYSGLLESNFPLQFAQFAGAVAQRYPWVEKYTPINEPMTTARFSGLYGHWYPHHRNSRSFARAFINQCRATVLAMKAIRVVNPSAELVQTEDLGTTYSTVHMAYQQQFDNDRRWLTWDILCGRVNHQHALRGYLEAAEITCDELDWFSANPCPPQVIGINHYVTSDRYLDERTRLYPHHTHGGNEQEAYADLDAVRVQPGGYDGWQVIESAAKRYQTPVALTEVHIGCTREEQLRWFRGAMEAANSARRTGVNVCAVTAWSLFGAYNWDRLLTQENGNYESGAFDVRSPLPRATAVAALIKRSVSEVNSGTACLAPVASEGWWQRPEKVLYGSLSSQPVRQLARHASRSRKLVICGAKGVLGRALVHECNKRNLPFVGLSRADLDIADPVAVEDMLDELRPWGLVNAAGYRQVDQAEANACECYRSNAEGPHVLAIAASRLKIPFVTFSSDLVFDGRDVSSYTESSVPAPLSVYGASKLAGETTTLPYPTTLCIRSAAYFGALNGRDFLSHGLTSLSCGAPYIAFHDLTVSPTYLPDLASATLDLAIDGCVGLVHLVNQGAATWADFLEAGAIAAGISTRTLQRRSVADANCAARRPVFSALSSERVYLMPTLDNAIARNASVYQLALDVARSESHTA